MENQSESFISLKGIDKIYPNGVQAVFDFNLDIQENDFIVLVGPSGCGKTTTLRMIAGLEDISSGELYIEGKLSNFVESKDRNIAMVFQSYALYPNLTVYDNMAFGLKIKKVPKEEIDKRVFEAAKILDLGKYLDRKPRELSGGQMQRVALGRAIVRNAPIFLMDEPLSNLDAKLRVSMRSEIVRIHEQVHSTTVYVTHDQVEAMTMATKIVVMNQGFVQQIGKPEEIYSNPCNSFVATFIGTPSMNLFKARYKDGSILVDGLKLNELKNIKNVHDKFYVNKLKIIKNALTSDYDLLSEEDRNNEEMINALPLGTDALKILREIQSHIAGYKGAVTVKEIKKHFSLKKLFRKKNKQSEPNFDRSVLKEMGNTIEKYILTQEHEVFVGIRPEKIKLSVLKEGDSAKDKIIVEAKTIELLGAEYNVFFDFNGKQLVAKLSAENKISLGQKLILDLDEKALFIYDEVTGENILNN